MRFLLATVVVALLGRTALGVRSHGRGSIKAAVVNEYPGDPVSAAQDLLERVVPSELVPFFQLELISPQKSASGQADAFGEGTVEVMQLSSYPSNGTVVLRGSGGVELASALNWYMNDYLNITYDWNTYAEGQWNGTGLFVLDADTTLPLPPSDGPVRPRQLSQSYYLNVCTPGYSLAFVDWDYWQKHIDWMALNGINLPLALTGEEWVWSQVWSEFNLTTEDTTPFFSGPAFLPWFRMGNMRGWGGPITTANWMESQKELQIKILARQRGLGMRPVLAGFAGFVPAAFATHYPNASLTRAPAWANFAEQYGEVYQLAATDPLFPKIGGRFIELQAQTYGTDHIYSCDTFNEMDPPSGDLDALAASSRAVYESMAVADPDAIWLMQGWLFIHDFWTQHPDRVKAYLGGVPTPTAASPSGMWVLDLFGTSEPVWPNTEAFYGKPFILCTLLNFGGQQGIYGNMAAVEDGVNKVLNASTTDPNGTRPIGVGITMEGIWFVTQHDGFIAWFGTCVITLALWWLMISSGLIMGFSKKHLASAGSLRRPQQTPPRRFTAPRPMATTSLDTHRALRTLSTRSRPLKPLARRCLTHRAVASLIRMASLKFVSVRASLQTLLEILRLLFCALMTGPADLRHAATVAALQGPSKRGRTFCGQWCRFRGRLALWLRANVVVFRCCVLIVQALISWRSWSIRTWVGHFGSAQPAHEAWVCSGIPSNARVTTDSMLFCAFVTQANTTCP